MFVVQQEKSSNLFEDGFSDSLSKLKLKETSTSTSTSTDFVKLFSMAKTNVVVEAPPTPGRPIFSFSVGSRKNIPSKWDDAQKWLIGGPDSPAHHHHNLVSKHSSNNGSHGHVVKPQQLEHHGKITTDQEEKVCKAVSVIQVPTNVPLNQKNQDSSDVVLLKGFAFFFSSFLVFDIMLHAKIKHLLLLVFIVLDFILDFIYTYE